MSHRPAPPPRTRSLVRTSHCSRSAPHALARAYELALPILRRPVAAAPPAAAASPVPGHRVLPQSLTGA